MEGNVLDINLLGRNYPFLSESCKLYDKLDETVEENDHNILYRKLCEQIVSNLKIKNQQYYELCKKLARNLNIFCSGTNECNIQPNCQILNDWLYNSMKKYNIFNGFINLLFYRMNSITHKLYYKNMCPYYNYDKNYVEPINIVKLNIFGYNMHTIVSIFKNNEYFNKLSVDFIKKVLNIYEHMNYKYCFKENKKDRKKINTCSYLESFINSYNIYICNNEKLKNKIPSLSSDNSVNFIGCKSTDKIKTLQITHDIEILASEEAVDSRLFGNGDEFISSKEHEHNNSLFSTIKLLFTVIATISGGTSILLLFYKFTPVRSLFRSRQKVKITRNNYVEDEEKELFYQMPDNMNINSHNQIYDIAYTNL
ncbi:variable surface protein [Plasmodium gonderi]|uniref:Variable surface protein n=1 Tax=Plasmodium gonderi TaxID=77519 RepID=A0A1Y1JQL9_PLAGO|nr:variable surface protein [Plasmodium gonderi]GAW84500.1 variable surface protein [Plasmodium gonderi]